jgi:hypothetical protein
MAVMNDFYSPLQNAALWLGAWLHGFEPFEAVSDTLQALNLYPHDGSLINDLKQLRAASTDVPKGEPALLLVLSGPGDPLPLQNPEALTAAHDSQGAIIIPSGPQGYNVVVLDSTRWKWFSVPGPLPAMAVVMPGEADQLMSAAVNQAAAAIDQMSQPLSNVASPRLRVGSLTDFYETPGLPSSVPPRAAQLIARADRATAIVAATVAHDHVFDPQLLSLSRHIRHARMSAVAYALAEWGRLAG